MKATRNEIQKPMKPMLLALAGFLGIIVMSPLVAADSNVAMIMVTMQIEGEHLQPGDGFYVRGTVTNIGTIPAKNVRVHIEGVPPDWYTAVEIPGNFSNLLPGESSTRLYSMVRGVETPNIFIWAQGENTNLAYSERIQVPIHPFVLGTVALTMGSLLVLRVRTINRLQGA